MSGRNDGGPAFPTGETMVMQGWPGMTLRDYLAAAALQSGLVSLGMAETPRRHGQTLGQQIAEIAYAIADRMLAERAR